MNSLPIFIALLAASALAFVIVPLWRHHGTADTTLERRREKNREVFRQREGELSEDLRQGLINADEHAKLLAELQRAFLLDMEVLDKQGTRKGVLGAGRSVVLTLAVVAVAASLILYRELGSGPDLELPALLERVGAAATQEEQLPALNELAAFLQERFERKPDDVLNGYSLGKLYMDLERFPEAITVLQQVQAELEDGPDRATVIGLLAQAQYLQADSQITPDVQETIDQALRLDPNEYAVMGLLAVDAALVKQDLPAAIGYWRRQLSSAAPGSPQAERVRQLLAQFESFAAAEDPAAVAGPTITVTIDIAPELAAQVTDDMRLFVFVRSPQPGGPPILAVNPPASEFPLTLTLDNSNAMMPGRTLESAPELVVGARLSNSGQPTEQSGDFQTLSEPFTLAEQTAPLELVIDEVVP
jgi:cytochrome c-type biogenesis protein CcmH